jgi:hypothetical protein
MMTNLNDEIARMEIKRMNTIGRIIELAEHLDRCVSQDADGDRILFDALQDDMLLAVMGALRALLRDRIEDLSAADLKTAVEAEFKRRSALN